MIWASLFLGLAMRSAPPAAPPSHDFTVIRAATAAVVGAMLAPLPQAGPDANLAPDLHDDMKAMADDPGSTSSPVCSLNVVNEDPAKILQVLSTQTKTNLVLLSPSDKKLTLNLRSVPLLEMIRHICALSGLQFLKVNETFVLATPEALKSAYEEEWEAAHPTPAPPTPAEKPAIVVSSLVLNHVSAARLVPVLEKFFDKQVVSIAAGPDVENPKVTTQNTNQTTGTATLVLTPPAGSEEMGRGKVLVVRGPEPLVREVEEIARQLDVERSQVVIQVVIYDILDSALREVGTSWNLGSTTVSESGNEKLEFGTFQRGGFNFSATIKALEKKDAAKVLASPNIAVLDGERAFILIGDRINYPVLVGFSNANTPIFSKEEERVGIYLQVAASVSTDGQITLSLYPQVSTVTGFLEVNGASYPQISTREAQSTLRMRSGETLIMGGLMKTEEVRQLERIPLLGQIPFLGELFTRRRSTKSASQVLIAIRPTLIKNDEP